LRIVPSSGVLSTLHSGYLQAMSHASYQIKNLDHHGLVAAMCQELRIAQRIDAVIPKQGEHQLSHGQALVAMIINGLGFHSRTLHMFPQFFEDKPVERLIGPGITAAHLNDDALGRCLDALFAAGVSPLYQVLAEKVVEDLGLDGSALHLDITSFHLDGRYKQDDPEETSSIQLVKGYSRDHRPDLNQVVLELICESEAGLPVFLQALSGNTNDQRAFTDVISHHINSLQSAQTSRYFVGDAALYTKNSLQALQQQDKLFVSRVPMTLKEAKHQVVTLNPNTLEPLGNGYHADWVESDYAGVPQRWLRVRSEQAAAREQKTLYKRLLKESQTELKRFQKLTKTPFACQVDAERALAECVDQFTLIGIEQPSCQALSIYRRSGRPSKDETPIRIDYHITGQPYLCLKRVEEAKAHTGIFILATNDLSDTLSMTELLTTYKSQQSVERGFRFLKSPDFLTASLFLKKPERIEALLMVMTCSLMIYAALEHRIRQGLKEQNRDIPDMKRKPTKNPTTRWVFQCFGGIHALQVDSGPPMVIGLQAMHNTIIEVLGERYQRIYS
jgi:transposase